MAQTTVTRDRWSVSVTSSSAAPGYTLHTFRMYGPRESRVWRGEGYGRTFTTRDAAWSWAREHGYLEPYVVAWCRHCRQRHAFLGRRSGFCQTLGVFTSRRGLYNPRIGAVDDTIYPPYARSVSVAATVLP